MYRKENGVWFQRGVLARITSTNRIRVQLTSIRRNIENDSKPPSSNGGLGSFFVILQGAKNPKEGTV